MLTTYRVSVSLLVFALIATAIGCGSSVAQLSPSASAEISATPAASPTPDLFQGSLVDLRAAVGKFHEKDVTGELTWCGKKSAMPKTEDCVFTDGGVSEIVSAYPEVTFTQSYTRAKFDFLGIDPNFDATNAAVVTTIVCSYRLTETGYTFISGTFTEITSGHEAHINGTSMDPLVNGSYTHDYGSGVVSTYDECPASK